MKEIVVSALQELIVPELDRLKEEGRQIKVTLDMTNRRLDDVNIHLAHQSQRIDETNNRIDHLYEVIVRRDEHAALEKRLANLEQEVDRIKQRLAA